jgi:hypothetical protein
MAQNNAKPKHVVTLTPKLLGEQASRLSAESEPHYTYVAQRGKSEGSQREAV